ncbi:hypothetical protein EJ06DRAFT_550446 [Trichodelitschia bisporula]|uniref:4a-hydroxytetrahydrobiopterin dehydratase n=1 Tax=Trichodelitschia bisporula TaxID=703511 RepID=A0A6G1HR93_9PEZI|nr:hypothetical protein EJ06DRAFT_550446 [Trichodelitschia bisporula]
MFTPFRLLTRTLASHIPRRALTRSFTSHPPALSSASPPSPEGEASPPALETMIAKGEDISFVSADISTLIRDSGWKVLPDGRLHKLFKLQSYGDVLRLHTLIGKESDKRNHHPRMVSGYRMLIVRFKTHKPVGLTANDVTGARVADECAGKCRARWEDADGQSNNVSWKESTVLRRIVVQQKP